MIKYGLEFGIRAAQTYVRLCELSRVRLEQGHDSHPDVLLFVLLHDLMESLLSSNPFKRNRLIGPLSDVYWLSRGRMTILFAASRKPKTVVIVCISPRPMANEQRAEALIQQMILSGKVRISVPAARYPN